MKNTKYFFKSAAIRKISKSGISAVFLLISAPRGHRSLCKDYDLVSQVRKTLSIHGEETSITEVQYKRTNNLRGFSRIHSRLVYLFFKFLY